MSGEKIPYHLRTNKWVERSIFMELLIKINSIHNISKFRYIGFGAPQMEDFKLIHKLFNITELFCLEQEVWVHERQKFNSPLNCITYLNQSSSDFIDNYEEGVNSIVWLDYASPRSIGEQMREFQQLLQKSIPYDIVKITLNANPNSLCSSQLVKNPEMRRKRRLEKLSNRLGSLLPSDTTASMMTTSGLPQVLMNSLKKAINEVRPPVIDLSFIPLTSFTYNDKSHQMLTLTGITMEKGKSLEFLEESSIIDWEYFIGSSDVPMTINVPDLTLRERFAIDSLLPDSDPAMIQHEINILLDKSREKSMRHIESYKRYYRHYPQFSRVNL